MDRFFYNRYLCCCLLIFTICLSCNKKASVREETKDLVFIVNLVDDEQKIKEYLAFHQKVWPQVEAGFRKADYKAISIYRFNKLLVMTVTIPVSADINQLGKIAEGYDQKCREWNELMNEYQVGVPGTTEGQKWVQVENIYSFKNQQ